MPQQLAPDSTLTWTNNL